MNGSWLEQWAQIKVIGFYVGISLLAICAVIFVLLLIYYSIKEKIMKNKVKKEKNNE